MRGLVLALLLLLGAARAGGPLLVATIPPYADLAREVLGGGWEVRALVPAGGNPHVFAPRPSDLKAVARAAIVVQNGLGFDGWLVDKLVRPSGSRARVLSAEESARGLAVGGDPHLWTDPLAMGLFACDLARAAAEVDPDGREGYLARARSLQGRLAGLMHWGQLESLGLEQRAFVAYKNPFSYLQARYGLKRAYLIGKTPSAEPTARELAEARRVLERLGLGAIVAPYQVRREAERVAENLGVGVVYLDLLDERGSDYLAVWRGNLEGLFASLR